MDPITATTLAIGVGSTAFGAVSSRQQAQRQNEAVARSMRIEEQNSRIQQQQIADAAALEKEKRLREAQQLQGRLRVARGEAGVGLGGSTAALSRQIAFDLAGNQQIIDTNARNQIARVQSGTQANLAALSANRQSSLLAGFSGGLQGAQTGLSIGQGIQSLAGDNS